MGRLRRLSLRFITGGVIDKCQGGGASDGAIERGRLDGCKPLTPLLVDRSARGFRAEAGMLCLYALLQLLELLEHGGVVVLLLEVFDDVRFAEAVLKDDGAEGEQARVAEGYK